MRNSGVSPTPETFTCLLKACARRLENTSGDRKATLTRAFRLFYALQNKNAALLGRYHVNALLSCCSRANDWSAMFKLYGRMNRVGTTQRLLPASDPESDRLAEVKKKSKTSEHSAAVVESSADEWVSDRLRAFMSQRDNVSDHESDDDDDEHKGQSGVDALVTMRPDTVTYNVLLTGCAQRRGDATFKDALEIWNDFKADAKETAELTIRKREEYLSSTNGLKAAAKGKQNRDELIRHLELTESEYSVWRSMEKSSQAADEKFPLINVDTKAINALLTACLNADAQKNIEHAFVVIGQEFSNGTISWAHFEQSLKTAGLPSLFASLRPSTTQQLQQLARQGEDLDAITETTAPKPDAQTLSIVMSMLERCKLPTSVVSHFYRYMTTSTDSSRAKMRIRPDAVCATQYLKVLLDEKRIDDFFAYFKKVQRQEPRSDRIYDLALHAAVLNGSKPQLDLVWNAVRDEANLAHSTGSVFRPSVRNLANYLHGTVDLKQPLCAISSLRTMVDALTRDAQTDTPDTWWSSLAKEAANTPAVWIAGLKAIDQAFTFNLHENPSAGQEKLTEQPTEQNGKNTRTLTKQELREMRKQCQTHLDRIKEYRARQHASKKSFPSDHQDLDATFTSKRTPRWLTETIEISK
jgi:pentatricopeptide repeat protein